MKLGKIRISDTLLEEGNIEDLKELFSVFIPLHIEDRRFDLRCMIYTGYCEHFNDISGELIMPPEYSAIFNNDGEVNFEKQ